MAARDYRDDPYFRGRALDQYRVNAVSHGNRQYFHGATALSGGREWEGMLVVA